MKHDSIRSRGLLLIAMFVVFGLLGIFTARVSGQQYEEFPLHQALQKEANVKQCIAQTKAFATSGSGNPAMVKFYFTELVPAKMTGKDAMKEMPELMKDVHTFLVRAARSNRAGVAQEITKQVYAGMKKIAEGNYSPAARINAALVLGRLDRTPANNSNQTPPVPLLQTLPILMKLYTDENNVDGLRAAALQGIHRHALFGFPQIPAQQKGELTAMMIELLDAPAPSNRSKSAHAYLQRFAVDIADRLRGNQDKALGAKLISISTEPSKPGLIALYSASRLGSMGDELKGQVNNPEDVLKSWSRRVLTAFESEVARIKGLERSKAAKSQPMKPEDFLTKNSDRQRNRTSGSMGGMEMSGMDMDDMSGMEGMDADDGMGMDGMDMMGMMGSMSGGGGLSAVESAPQPPEVVASRQRLNSVLQQLQLGATGSPAAGLPKTPGGLLVSVADDKKKTVEEWVTEMETVLTTLNDKTLDDREKYLEGIEGQLAVLHEMAGVAEDAELDSKDDAEATELNELEGAAEAPETQPAKPETQPAAPETQPAKPETQPAEPNVLDELTSQ